MEYICYCLKRTENGYKGPKTYVGCTNNFERRIRQHNSEIKGGAICTTKACNNGCSWYPILFATGFVSQKEALSFEWHWKFESRKSKGEPSEKRKKGLLVLLDRPRFLHIRVNENSSISE